jgi:hypothetical protein
VLLFGVLLMTAERPHTASASPPSEAWSQVVNGLQIRLVADKKVYRSGDPIYLTLSHRNQDSLPWVASVDAPKNLGSDVPFYCLSKLAVVRLARGQEKEHRYVLRAVPSQRFYLDRLERLDFRVVRSTTAMLTTWAWQAAEADKSHAEPMLTLPPGNYVVVASYGGTGYNSPQPQ